MSSTDAGVTAGDEAVVVHHLDFSQQFKRGLLKPSRVQLDQPSDGGKKGKYVRGKGFVVRHETSAGAAAHGELRPVVTSKLAINAQVRLVGGNLQKLVRFVSRTRVLVA